MSLIATPGATADSYATVTYAYDYIATHDADGVFAATANDKVENLLKRATELLDALNWKGDKADETNSLRWPRAYVYDKDNNLLDITTVPVFLQRATSELAFHLVESDTTRGSNLSKIDLGGLKSEVDTDDRAADGPLPAQVMRMVQPYIALSGAELVRA